MSRRGWMWISKLISTLEAQANATRKLDKTQPKFSRLEVLPNSGGESLKRKVQLALRVFRRALGCIGQDRTFLEGFFLVLAHEWRCNQFTSFTSPAWP